MKKYLFVQIILILSIPAVSPAQILNRLKNKVQQAIERKIEQKVEEKVESEVDKAAGKAVDNAWDAVFGVDSSGNKTSGIDTLKLRQLGSAFSGANIPIENQYSFDIKTTLEMKFIPKSGKVDPPNELEMFFKQGAKYTGSSMKQNLEKSQGEMMVVIADYQNKAMILLMDDKKNKSRMVTSLDPTIYQQSQPVNTSEEPIDWNQVTEWRGYKKLGKRSILGYSCDGYSMSGEFGTSEVWVTREELLGIDYFFNPSNMGMKSRFPSEIPYGMLVEMQAVDLKTGDKSIITLKEVKKGINQVYKMSDFPTFH